MNSLELKNNIHSLIDQTSDADLLSLVYKLFKKNSDGTLSKVQEKELMIAYEESFNDENLISSSDFLKQNEKWH